MTPTRPTRVLLLALAAALPLLLFPAASGRAQEATWSAPSPYRSPGRTRQLVDTIALKLLLEYREAAAADGGWKTAGRPGVEHARYFVRTLDGGVRRTVEIALSPDPSGGYQIFVVGEEVAGEQRGPNPEIGAIQAGIQSLIDSVRSESQAPHDKRRLAYQSFRLSYVQSDRALALLKALGYMTIEYSAQQAETVYEKVYSPTSNEEWRLPVVIKLLDAEKTSIQDPPPASSTQMMPQMPMAGTPNMGMQLGLPELDGAFLHHETTGEPTQRLLIAYDPDDLEPMEQLLNLLRDEIDVPARQIVIEALVIEVHSEYLRELGLSWLTKGTLKLGRYRDDYALGVGGDDPTKVEPSAQPLTFLFDRTSTASTFDFQAALQAALADSQAKILSNPSVLVLEGRQAKIQIGEQVPVKATTVSLGAATESFTYFPVGIVLNLRPRVSEDGDEIVMQVETIVSSVRRVGSLDTTVRAPAVDSRVVQTFVRVANDTPFIIGGLTSNNEVRSTDGVPWLSQIPFLGFLFGTQRTERDKREVIIVVTPHVVPEETRHFGYVIPQESEIFDTFGHQLFHNAFRVRHQDVFDLDFLFESQAYRALKDCVADYTGRNPGKALEGPYAALLEGGMPGEEVLVHRMLWQTVRKVGYLDLVSTDRMIFFERDDDAADGTGFRLRLGLGKLLPEEPRGDKNALVLTFDTHLQGTPDRPFVQPTAQVSYEGVEPATHLARLARGNRRQPGGEPDRWTILLTDSYGGTAHPLDILKGVLVLKRILDLNPNLPLTIQDFRPGRQVIFPTETELRESFHLIDHDAARLFWEVSSYYPAFEDEFRDQALRLIESIGGCAGWNAMAPGPAGARTDAAFDAAPPPSPPAGATATRPPPPEPGEKTVPRPEPGRSQGRGDRVSPY